MGDEVYCLDASGVISGWYNYPPEVFPGLWQKVEALIVDGRILIAEEVYNELRPKTDEEFVAWLAILKRAVVPIDEKQQEFVQDILRNYNLIDDLSGKSQGDPFVIALAKCRNATVITAERPTGNMRGPKIPDVCKDLRINWGAFIDIARGERWAFR